MKTYKLEVDYDSFDFNPREVGENLTTMVCFHKRYNIGDEHPYTVEDFGGWEDMEEHLKMDYDILMIRPLYMYDHGNITISTSSFDCRWDSGQIGFVFIERRKWNEFMGEVEPTEEKLEQNINNDVEYYDKYLRGEVYQFSVYEVQTCELGHEHYTFVESLGGFTDREECENEGKHYIKNLESFFNKEILSK